MHADPPGVATPAPPTAAIQQRSPPCGYRRRRTGTTRSTVLLADGRAPTSPACPSSLARPMQDHVQRTPRLTG